MTKAVESSLDEAKKHGWNGRFDRAIMYGAHACLAVCGVPPGKTNRHSLHHLRRTGPARLLRRRLLPEPRRRRPRLGRLADVVKAAPELANSR